ncbi:hypothetical protein GCM10022238_00870 [Gordonia hankookensis]
MRIATTTSRTRPIDSPSGPSTAKPTNLATNTLLTDAMGVRVVAARPGAVHILVVPPRPTACAGAVHCAFWNGEAMTPTTAHCGDRTVAPA